MNKKFKLKSKHLEDKHIAELFNKMKTGQCFNIGENRAIKNRALRLYIKFVGM